MPQIDLERELREISRECSLQLLKNFRKLDILPWYSPDVSTTKAAGSAQFLRYDPLNTCFRTLPDGPRRFEGAIKTGRLSNRDAVQLASRLLGVCRKLLPRYKGRYAADLRNTIDKVIVRAADLEDHGLLEIEKDFSPDDLFAAMPWACRPDRHFAAGGFRSIAVKDDMAVAAKNPFAALGIAIDAVSVGPSAGLSSAEIMSILDLLEGRSNHSYTGVRGGSLACKTVLPSISGGFQGITIGNFVNLSDQGQHRVQNHLYQFGETIGQKCQELRHQDALRALQRFGSTAEVAKAFLTILPPTEHIIISKGKDVLGLRLMREDDYWAGYSIVHTNELNSLLNVDGADDFVASINGDQFHIHVKIVDELPSLDPVLMRLRMRASIAQITSTIDRASSLPTLRRQDLAAAIENLERQIADGLRPNAACKALYAVHFIRENYDAGEVRLHNDGCRKFIEAKLNKPAVAYQVSGKAAPNFQRLVRRFVEDGLQFEAPAGAILRVRWRPVQDAVI